MVKYDDVDFSKEIPFIRKRCPNLNEQELKEAEELFRDYLRLCMEIYEERQKTIKKGNLTEK